MFSSSRTNVEVCKNKCLDVFHDTKCVPSNFTVIEVDGVAVPGTSSSLLFDNLFQVHGIIFVGLDNIQNHSGAMFALAIPTRYLIGLGKRKRGDSIYRHGKLLEKKMPPLMERMKTRAFMGMRISVIYCRLKRTGYRLVLLYVQNPLVRHHQLDPILTW